MNCRNYTGTVSRVLCREVYYIYRVLIWESPLSQVHCIPVHLISLCCVLGIFSEKPLDACVHN